LKYKKLRPLVKEQERFKGIPKLKLYANGPSLSELFQGKDKSETQKQGTVLCLRDLPCLESIKNHFQGKLRDRISWCVLSYSQQGNQKSCK